MAGKHKERIGKVVSDKMEKTVVVEVEFATRHPLYQKTIRRSVKYKAHDEKNECKVDDQVRIVETKPFSSGKRWRVDEIVRKGEAVDIKPKEVA
jgi:small subunit ribosomal protein S17